MIGKLVVILVFSALVVGVYMIPARMIGQENGRPPAWRNVRYWAMFVAAMQIVVYAVWG